MPLEFRPFGIVKGVTKESNKNSGEKVKEHNLEDNQLRRIKALLEDLKLSSEVDLSEIEQYNPSEHIDQSKLFNLEDDQGEISSYTLEGSDIKEKYSTIDNNNLLRNIREFTRLDKELISDPDYSEYSRDLENIRLFPQDFLRDRGIFISLSKQDLIDTFPYLRHSSLYLTGTDEAYSNRYMLSIKLPNGDVVTHTGYRPEIFQIPGPKYETPFYDWMSQGSVLGNLESLEIYKNKKEIYVVEGFFDAYRINQVLESPSVAILGSILTKEKSTILQILKDQGYSLIYVPDQDESGMSDRLMNSKLFDNIMTYGDFDKDKDFDSYCGNKYVTFIQNKYKDDSHMINVANVSDMTKEELDLVNKEIISGLKYKKPLIFTLPKITGF